MGEGGIGVALPMEIDMRERTWIDLAFESIFETRNNHQVQVREL